MQHRVQTRSLRSRTERQSTDKTWYRPWRTWSLTNSSDHSKQTLKVGRKANRRRKMQLPNEKLTTVGARVGRKLTRGARVPRKTKRMTTKYRKCKMTTRFKRCKHDLLFRPYYEV